MQQGTYGFMMIVLGTLMWSADTLVRYPLLTNVRAETIVFTEHLILTLIFAPALMLSVADFKFKKIRREHWVAFFIIGVLGSAVSTLAFTAAFSLINPSLVILLQKLQVFVAIGGSAVILKEKLSSRFNLSALIAITGALMISWKDIAPFFLNAGSPANNSSALLGYALALLAVLGWGLSTVYGKKLSLAGFNENQLLSGRFIFGFFFLLIFCLTRQSLPDSELTREDIFKILLMVLLSGLIGMTLYYKGLRLVSAHHGAIAELFFPLSAVIINWIFLGQRLEALQIAGALLLVGASLIINFLKPSEHLTR